MAYGMSQILVYGSIFESLRAGLYKWGADEHAPFQSLGEFLSGLLKCMMCTSTWVGFFLSLTFYSPTMELMNFNPYFSWFFDGCLASGAVWGINALVEYWEGNRHTN